MGILGVEQGTEQEHELLARRRVVVEARKQDLCLLHRCIGYRVDGVLAQAHGRGILQMGTADLDDAVEGVSPGGQQPVQFL